MLTRERVSCYRAALSEMTEPQTFSVIRLTARDPVFYFKYAPSGIYDYIQLHATSQCGGKVCRHMREKASGRAQRAMGRADEWRLWRERITRCGLGMV